MRLPFLVATLAASSVTAAHADSFVELAGGMAVPVGGDTWTNTADASPNLGARVGAVGDSGLGGMLQVDWTPINLDATGGSFGVGSTDFSAHRFRALADAVLHHQIAPRLWVSGRIGAGVDITHASATLVVLGNTANASSTDTGFAFEVGGGLWLDLGSFQLGGEVALPVGAHSHKASSTTDITIDYTSYDIDLVVALRVLSR
jgi:hypothetical protein